MRRNRYNLMRPEQRVGRRRPDKVREALDLERQTPLDPSDQLELDRMARAAERTGDHSGLAADYAAAIKDKGPRARLEMAEIASSLRLRSSEAADGLLKAVEAVTGSEEAETVRAIEVARSAKRLSPPPGLIEDGVPRLRSPSLPPQESKPPLNPTPQEQVRRFESDPCLEEWLAMREAAEKTMECERRIYEKEQEIARLRAQIAKLESGGSSSQPSPPSPPSARVPSRRKGRSGAVQDIIGDVIGIIGSAVDNKTSAEIAELTEQLNTALDELEVLRDELERLMEQEERAKAIWQQCCRETGSCDQ